MSIFALGETMQAPRFYEYVAELNFSRDGASSQRHDASAGLE